MKSLNNIDQLQGLIATLELENTMKKDYVASSSSLVFVDGNLTIVHGKKSVTYEATNHFHSQIAEKLGIPAGYYNKMLTGAKNLLDHNANHWLHNESKNFLVRTFEGAADEYKNKARAFLSDSYSIIDNYSVLMEALEAIKKTGITIDVVNAELSDTRMYLKVVCPEVEVEAKEFFKTYRLATEAGTGVISGFILQNSEIGKGAFSIIPRAVLLGCTNGMIYTADKLKNVHLGAKMDELGFNQNPDVMKKNLDLIRSQIQHAVKIFLSKKYVQKIIDHYSDLGQPKILAPVQNVIEVVGKTYQISEERKANILNYFIEGGDTRRMGLASAMTRECQDLTNPDLKHDTEVASFEMLQGFEKIEAAAMKIKRSAN